MAKHVKELAAGQAMLPVTANVGLIAIVMGKVRRVCCP